MSPRPYIAWPSLPPEPSGWQYFWHQLPLGVPGMLTFVTGLLLFFAALREVTRRPPEKRMLFVFLAGVCFAMGCGGLRAALHALVLDEGLLAFASSLLYVLSLPLAPAAVSCADHMTDRKYRLLRPMAALLWAAAAVSVFFMIMNEGLYLAGSAEKNSFGIRLGIHPREAILVYIRIFVVAALVPFVLWKDFGRGAGARRVLLLSIPVILLFFALNAAARHWSWPLPSLQGYLFIPLLFIGADAFRSYLRDLQQLLFEKLGLFYLMNLVLAGLFVAMALAAAFGMSPDGYREPKWLTLIPALPAAAGVFALGILVAGMNPREPVNQFAATYTYCMGFVILLHVFQNMGLRPIAALRLSQLAWLLIPWSLSAFARFVLIGFRLPIPGWMRFFDLIVIATSALALSPWSHPGYYVYSFGVFAAMGPVIFIWSLASLCVYVLLFREYLRAGRSISRVNRTAVWGVVILLVGLCSSLPPSVGFAVPPAGIFAVFPAAVLVFITIRKRALVSSAVAYRLNGRLTSQVLIVAPLCILVVLSLLLREEQLELGLLHLAVISTPVVLFAYQLTHFLSRPLTEQMARSFDDQLAARADAEEARHEAELARRETDELNRLGRRMAELKFLDDILDEIFAHIRKRYGCEHIALIFIDSKTEEFYVHRALHPEHFSTDEKSFADSFRAPASPHGGVHWRVHRQNEILYIPEVSRPPEAIVDRIHYRRLSYRSLLVAPLFMEQHVIGLISAMNYDEPMALSDRDVKAMGRLCDQAAGAIHTSYLWRETELARNREKEARREAEGIRRELEDEIRMASRIQESLLPRELPEPPQARIAYRYAPMLAVGGDFLDLHYAEERHLLGFFICDVSGHGVPAAFVASMVKMALRNWNKYLLEPAAILSRIQERLRDKMAGYTLTACVGCMELESGRVRMAVAGHPPPMLISPGGVEVLPVRGRLVMDHPLWNSEREERVFQLEPGDKLLLFTDGLVEARSPQGWMLGDDKLLAWVGRNPQFTADEVCSDLQDYLRRYTGGLELDDDFTILAIEYRGENASPAKSDASP